MPVGEQYRPAPFENDSADDRETAAEANQNAAQNTRRQLGVKILTQVGLENDQKEMANSSSNESRGNKEDLDQLRYLCFTEEGIDLDTLKSHGANAEDVNSFIPGMHPRYIAEKIDELLEFGVDPDKLVYEMFPEDIMDNIETLVSHGANIDIDWLAPRVGYGRKNKKDLENLLKYGADVNKIASKLDPDYLEENLPLLKQYGYQPKQDQP